MDETQEINYAAVIGPGLGFDGCVAQVHSDLA